MSLEIVGPERLSVSRSITVPAKGLQKNLPQVSTPVGGKLAGCVGASVGALLAKCVGECGGGVSGVFTAEDGVSTEPIAMDELVQGVILHSADAAGAPLPDKMGGPLRVCFPEGVAVQASPCGTGTKPVNLKSIVKLTLSSQFELKDATLARELSRAAPNFILLLEERHAPTILAMATHYGGVEGATAASIRALDARGFTLAVTTADGAEREGVLVPFPRPLEAGSPIEPQLERLVAEMHAAAFDALGVRFKLRHRFYWDAARERARASPLHLAAVVAVGAFAAGLMVRARVRS